MQNLSTSYTQTVHKQGLFTGFLFIHTLEIIIHKYKKVINMSGGVEEPFASRFQGRISSILWTFSRKVIDLNHVSLYNI